MGIPASTIAVLASAVAQMIDYGFSAVKASLRTAEQVSGNRFARSAFRTSLRVFSAIPPLKRRVFSGLGND